MGVMGERLAERLAYPLSAFACPRRLLRSTVELALGDAALCARARSRSMGSDVSTLTGNPFSGEGAALRGAASSPLIDGGAGVDRALRLLPLGCPFASDSPMELEGEVTTSPSTNAGTALRVPRRARLPAPPVPVEPMVSSDACDELVVISGGGVGDGENWLWASSDCDGGRGGGVATTTLG